MSSYTPGDGVEYINGQKQVYTDDGRRVDIYEGGQGSPDGPGHDHYWITYDRQGNVASEGGGPDRRG